MKQLFSFTLRLAVIVALAVWLADRPGTARIVWHGYVIETSAAFLGLTALAVAFIFYLLFRFWHLVSHGPTLWRLRRKLNKFRQGQDNLTKGLVAIAGGDAAEAGRYAVNARKLLGTTPTTQLLQAQAAQLAGDHSAAREIFTSLAKDSATAGLGYRGLILQARHEKDWEEVDRLVEKLRAVQPDMPWLNLLRFEKAARQQSWAEASTALIKASAARMLEPQQVRQHRAALLVATSQDEARQGHTDKALQAAEQAAKQSSEWLPAVINLAQKQMAGGHRRAAYRTVEKNWPRMPHPQLASVYRANDADVLEAFKNIEHLCRDMEEVPTNRLILAEAALAADIWGEARRHLIALISQGSATQGVYRLLARLERRESGDEQAALQWMLKAVDAAPDPVWLCQTCGGGHTDWQPLCKHCKAFDTLNWQSPGISRAKDTQPLLAANDWMS